MAEKSKSFEFSSWELFKNFQKKPGSLWFLIGLAALGLVLLLNGNDKGNSSAVNPQQNTGRESVIENSAVATRQQLELELTGMLESIAGAGRVKVELYVKSGNRKVWERQSRINKRASQEQSGVNTEEDSTDELVIAKDSEGHDTPILKEELAPIIQGVIVVASGAQDARIKELLTNTVMTILDLPAHRVMIIPAEIEEGKLK